MNIVVSDFQRMKFGYLLLMANERAGIAIDDKLRQFD